MSKFLNTMLGSWVKVFGVAFLTLVVANGSFRGLDWFHVLDAAAISTLPAIINYFNPLDSRYGKEKN